MADIVSIITDLDVLRERANECNPFEEKATIRNIKTLLKLKAYEDYVCLSAPQIGVKSRLFCMKFSDGIKTFINPVITKVEGKTMSLEMCKCISENYFVVARNNKIRVEYLDEDCMMQEAIFEGFQACLFQQMVNLLDGLLLSDFAIELDNQAMELLNSSTEEEKIEFFNACAKHFEKALKKTQADIEADEESKKIQSAIDFMSKATNGEIEVEPIADDDPLLLKAKEENKVKDAD